MAQGYHLTRSMLILSEPLSKTVVPIPRRCWQYGDEGVVLGTAVPVPTLL